MPLMRDYFIRRFLLLFPTLLVITVIVFAVTRIAPGGPLEQAMMDMFYDAPSHEELKELVITGEMIDRGVSNVDDGDELLRKSA